MVEGEGEETHTGTVGATSRATFNARDHVGEGKNISLLLESDQQHMLGFLLLTEGMLRLSYL